MTDHQFRCLTELIKWMGFMIMIHLIPDPTLKMVITALGMYHGLTYLYLMYFKKVDERGFVRENARQNERS